MTPLRIRTGVLPWLFGTLCLAVIVHFSSILLLPHLAERDAYNRVSSITDSNNLKILPVSRPGLEPFPATDPNMTLGICWYDLNNGPLNIKVAVPGDNFLSLSFHQRRGTIFYSMTDQAAVKGDIKLTLATADEIDDLQSQDDPDGPLPDLRITAPSPQGFVIFRALAPQAHDIANAQNALKAVSCSTMHSEN
ncbi:MAG: DUF1254 domain-containing protein [Hyphomicrobiales bacterium]|nr:DUF1254 domain-containing protein [Hyphomicrobiales bacterium]MDE2115186.1 DUF1254 domain-containing protein [Hyphomicrobiales bacterium]